MELIGSSFPRIATSVQSKKLNKPPQLANCPPKTGARDFIAVILPYIRSPRGEFFAPLTPCHMDPPTAPIKNAEPTSSIIRYGHGSRPDAIPSHRYEP